MEYKVGEGTKIGYMPTEFDANGNLVETKIVAGADITKGQLLSLSDAMTVVPATAGSDAVIGIAMFDAKSGANVSIECEGLVRFTASAQVTAPAKLKAAAAGKVAPWVTGTDNSSLIVGIALADASGDGKTLIGRLTL